MISIKYQKKKNQGNQAKNPFPVPVSCLNDGSARWNYFVGELSNVNVIVRKKGDIEYIHGQGCFGEIVYEENQDNLIVDSLDTNLVVGESDQTSGENTPKCEFLQLTCEESFFLSFGLGCLFVKLNEEYISIEKQWGIYCQQKTNFPVTYAAYHHFRSKGWVPKNGVRYGVDMVLYKKGPAFYHASFMVVIQTMDKDSMQLVPFNNVAPRTFDWRSMSGLLRLSTTVSKDILFCYVGIPSNLTKEDQELPMCLRKLQITEKLVARWSSSKEGDKELCDIDKEF